MERHGFKIHWKVSPCCMSVGFGRVWLLTPGNPAKPSNNCQTPCTYIDIRRPYFPMYFARLEPQHPFVDMDSPFPLTGRVAPMAFLNGFVIQNSIFIKRQALIESLRRKSEVQKSVYLTHGIIQKGTQFKSKLKRRIKGTRTQIILKIC